VAVESTHVVLGAAGGTGSAVVRELEARGRRVRAVTRGGTSDAPERVEQLAADVGTAEGARRACQGAAVVYHCAQPPYTKWAELFPPMTQAVIDGAAAAGAKLAFEAAGHTPKIGVASRPMVRITGLFNPLVRELNETLYQFERPFVSDASKFQRVFGPFEPTPHPKALPPTVAWFRGRYAA
jgi:nucleoside-diphosphate-sugar epimerase